MTKKTKIVIGDILEEKFSSVIEEVNREHADKIEIIKCDVTIKNDIQLLADTTINKYEKIDIWINNAGIAKDNLLIRMKDEEFQSVWDVNAKAVFWGTQIAAKKMIKKRQGTILNIGSVSGLYGNLGQMNYSSAKAAVNAMTKTAARELAPRGITVNCILSGFIRNDFTANMPDKLLDEIESQIPLFNQDVSPTQAVADAASFLVSNKSKYITGAFLRVDGGLAIGF